MGLVNANRAEKGISVVVTVCSRRISVACKRACCMSPCDLSVCVWS